MVVRKTTYITVDDKINLICPIDVIPCVMQVKMRCTLTAVSIFRPIPSIFQAMVTVMESKYLNCYMVIMHLDNMTSFHAFSLMHPNNQATDA